jgi:methyl-accepting chemotaxis protein
MLDAEGKMVGAWYTGYRLDSIASLSKEIEDATILDHGFEALLKPTGAAVFHGKQVSTEEVARLRQHPDGWMVSETVFPAWGYTVLTAYPVSDVSNRMLKSTGELAAGVLILVVLIVIMQYLLLRSLVVRPVRELTGRLENADLNTRLETRYNDEIGALAASFNHFVERLRQTLHEVREGSTATSVKSGEIRGIAHRSVGSLAEQRESAEAASAAVARLSLAIASTSSHTQEASEHARSAAEAASGGNQLVASAVTMIRGLSEDTRQSATSVANLSERVRQIGSIVGVIDEIASGTNLLALNASIEAARAGEHGRGFAVVAGEVRRLAERTAQATREVSAMVSGIAEETDAAAHGIETACTRAVQGAEAISGLSSTFEQIAALVIEVDGRVGQIAQAARDEAEAATGVSQTMQRVAANAGESASGAEQVVAASGDLLETAHSLEALVQQFDM